MKEYGTVMVTLADEDKEEALPLVKRFYELGFNIEATAGTGAFLKKHGIRTRIRGKISEGSDEILRAIRAGYVSYIINTRAVLSGVHYDDGIAIHVRLAWKGTLPPRVMKLLRAYQKRTGGQNEI